MPIYATSHIFKDDNQLVMIFIFIDFTQQVLNTFPGPTIFFILKYGTYIFAFPVLICT